MVKLTFKDNGVLEVPSPEELRDLDNDTYIIAYTNGTMGDGRPFYAYIAAMPSKYKEFHDLTASGAPMVLSDYGLVITADYAEEPPQEIVDYMRENYGFEDNLSEVLQNELSRQRSAYIEKKEVGRVQNIVEQMKQQALTADLKKKMSEATGTDAEQVKQAKQQPILSEELKKKIAEGTGTGVEQVKLPQGLISDELKKKIAEATGNKTS